MSIHPNFIEVYDAHITPISGTPWGRMHCQWDETFKRTGDVYKKHHYVPVVNVHTGEVYDDCSKFHIYVHMVVHTALRPVQILGKTIYHLCLPISIPHTIYKTIMEELYLNECRDKEEQTSYCYLMGKCVRKTLQCPLDIVRTPIYGVAMTALSLVAVIYAPIQGVVSTATSLMTGSDSPPSTHLYDFRETIAKIQRLLYWGSDDVDCLDFLQPIRRTTCFGKELGPDKMSLDFLASTIIQDRREVAELFYNPVHPISRHNSYYSTGFKPPSSS
jgi:hypothetical protein